MNSQDRIYLRILSPNFSCKNLNFKNSINFDLNLTDTEAILFIKEMGFDSLQEIKQILKITSKVPLFLNNYLKNFVVKNNAQKDQKKKQNFNIIEDLKNVVKKELSEKVEKFYNEYFETKFDREQKGKFKEILCSLNLKTKGFDYDEIKDILDYQLMECQITRNIQPSYQDSTVGNYSDNNDDDINYNIKKQLCSSNHNKNF